MMMDNQSRRSESTILTLVRATTILSKTLITLKIIRINKIRQDEMVTKKIMEVTLTIIEIKRTPTHQGHQI
jgi:hypothetical protein